MSYLVDALKKAERERHEQRSADMRAVSSVGVHDEQGRSSAVLRLFVIVLVACNAALLAYLVWPDNSGATGVPAEVEVAQSKPVAQARPIVQSPGEQADAEAPPRSREDAAQSPGVAQRDRPSRAPEAATDAPRLPRPSRNAAVARGRVTYADTPLDEGRSTLPAWSNQEDAPSIGDLGGSVPDVAINGHLFSSVPGRSFILVNGRRYHEGERLAAGPAVESVDARGATLNYRGQRYHVDGPG